MSDVSGKKEGNTDLGVGYTAVVAGLGVRLVLAVAVAASGTATHGDKSGSKRQISASSESPRTHPSSSDSISGCETSRMERKTTQGQHEDILTVVGGQGKVGGVRTVGRPFELAMRDDKPDR